MRSGSTSYRRRHRHHRRPKTHRQLNPDPPEPPGVDAIAVDIEDEKLLTSRENDDAMNAPDPTYQPLVCAAGCPSSPSNAFAHFSTQSKTIAYGRYFSKMFASSLNRWRSVSAIVMYCLNPSERR